MVLTSVLNSNGPRRVYGKRGKCKAAGSTAHKKSNVIRGSLSGVGDVPSEAIHPSLAYQDPFRCINCYTKVFPTAGKKVSDVLGRSKVNCHTSQGNYTGDRESFNVTILEAFDVIFDMKQKVRCSEARLDEISSLLCLKCTSILANLYKCYIEFVEVTQAPSVMADVLAQSQTLEKFHSNRVSDVLLKIRSGNGVDVLIFPASPDFERHEEITFEDDNGEFFQTETEVREEDADYVLGLADLERNHDGGQVLSSCEDMHNNSEIPGWIREELPSLSMIVAPNTTNGKLPLPAYKAVPKPDIKCCGYFLQNLDKLRSHYNIAHPENLDTIAKITEYIACEARKPKGAISPLTPFHDVKAEVQTVVYPKCSDCGYFFPSTNHLFVHYTSSHPEQLDEISRLKRTLQVLKKDWSTAAVPTSMPAAKYTCDLCKVPYTDSSFRLHDTTHASEDYKCTHCELGFQFRGTLMRHTWIVHPRVKGKVKGKAVKVNMAGGKLKKKKETVVKVKKPAKPKQGKIKPVIRVIPDKAGVKKNPPGPQTCPVCLAVFNFRSSLEKHLQLKHRPTVLEPYVRCDHGQCRKIFSCRKHLANHKRCHLERKFKCGECGYATITAYHLDIHHKNAHVEKNFLCSPCGKTFPTKQHFQSHSLMHDNSPKAYKFSCTHPGCEKKFKRIQNLLNHRPQHSSERAFMCEHCGGSYKKSDTLKTHIRKVHLEVRPRLIGSCTRPKGIGNGKLKVEGPPYRCRIDTCGKTYLHQTGMYRHMREMHPVENKPYSCEHCEKSFASSFGLAHHKRMIHSIKHTNSKKYRLLMKKQARARLAPQAVIDAPSDGNVQSSSI